MILSICIPSYNRFEHLTIMLDSIFTAKSQDFEVVIVDNGSDKDILDVITCKDERLKIIKRDIIVKGPTNARLALDYADGKYAMVCLDKDFIEGNKLDTFLNLLKKSRGITCGYCDLNGKKKDIQLLISNDIVHNIYRCGHPSGTFFINKGITENTAKLDLLNPNSVFYNNPFLIDLLYAQCLRKGKQAILSGSLVKTESLKKAANQKSHSYSSADDNIYFIPKNRRKQFYILIEHLNLLNLDVNTYDKIVDKLMKKTLREISIGFMDVMKNTNICMHHGIRTKQIRKSEAMNEIIIFLREMKSITLTRVPEWKKIFFILKNTVFAIVNLYGINRS